MPTLTKENIAAAILGHAQTGIPSGWVMGPSFKARVSGWVDRKEQVLLAGWWGKDGAILRAALAGGGGVAWINAFAEQRLTLNGDDAVEMEAYLTSAASPFCDD
jgi:hypothetical protein